MNAVASDQFKITEKGFGHQTLLSYTHCQNSSAGVAGFRVTLSFVSLICETVFIVVLTKFEPLIPFLNLQIIFP